MTIFFEERRKKMRIGITERGDAGMDLSWYETLRRGNYDGAILITKCASRYFREKGLALYRDFPHLIIHGTCTGWGGSWLEPNVPAAAIQFDALRSLVAEGFPVSNIVLRVDPVIPTKEGLYNAETMFSWAERFGGLSRIRISVLDEYRHVKERLVATGHAPFYGSAFQPDWEMKRSVIRMLKRWPQLNFETCAEDWLAASPELHNVTGCGCVSAKDLELMGLPADPGYAENIQKRTGCHCLACKTELLSRKKRCPNQCVYCYWRD